MHVRIMMFQSVDLKDIPLHRLIHYVMKYRSIVGISFETRTTENLAFDVYTSATFAVS
jgi:hypothetical protein